MGVPVIYRRTGEKAIASYNYTDIADATGNVIFNGFAHQEQTSVSYALNAEAFYSEGVGITNPDLENGYTSVAGNTSSFNKDMDLDFDVVLNRSQRIKGKAWAQFTWGSPDTTDALARGEGYIICRIRKWDGTTETEISSAQSETLVVDANAGHYASTNILIDLPTITHFKKGDTLRVTIEYWWKKTNTNARYIRFYHDPQNALILAFGGTASGFTYPTTFKAHIPFMIGL